MTSTTYHGSTAIVSRLYPGAMLKLPLVPNVEGPRIESLKKDIRLAFSVEEPILKMLGSHPCIVQYMGRQGDGIVLGEASHGNLEAYIGANSASITPELRQKWCRQAAEATTYIHSHGVIHADMRPENFLVHESSPGKLDLLLCDFGGAKCDKLQLDGGHLPDGPFYDPIQGAERSTATDIFSLGSVFYMIMTGLWPYRLSNKPFESVEEMLTYFAMVESRFRQGKYPDVGDLAFGDIMMGCWLKHYEDAGDILKDIQGSVPKLQEY